MTRRDGYTPLFKVANLFSERSNGLKTVKTVRDSPNRISAYNTIRITVQIGSIGTFHHVKLLKVKMLAGVT